MKPELYAANHPARFWRPLPSPSPEPAAWDVAVRRSAAALPAATRCAGDRIERLLDLRAGRGRLARARRGFALLEKIACVRRVSGMTLLNSHPAYLREHLHRIYEAFLRELRGDGACWRTLPGARAGRVVSGPGAEVWP